ncbi:MAG: hypothetical protein COV99_04100 [Bacteroidetes bacterium CG12_big_fil_rev_8_21_14_0_65_60_17]|nr:MAG: hypothetical protein COV99_04100 [Bacteroidetes bacterium CG12_big_fil_rev_8_21_14_0_65_60_17]
MTRYWKSHRARLLDVIIRLELRRRLAGMHTRGCFTGNRGVVNLIVANHTGRYDGFAIWRAWFAGQKGGRLYTLMLQAQLDRYRIFNGAGAIGFVPDRPQTLFRIARFVSTDLVAGDAILMFPQGRIMPGDALPLRFGQLPRLATWSPYRVQLTAVGLATEMLHGTKPSLFMDIDEPVMLSPDDDIVGLAEQRVAGRVKAIRHLLHTHGEQAITQFSMT